MNTRIFILLIVLFGIVINKGMAFEEQDILNYFGSRCQSQGDFTRSVLADSEALVTILEQIRDDENCVSVSGALSRFNHINRQMVILQEQTKDEVRISSLEAQEVDILKLISSESDPTIQYELKSALRNLQLEKINLIHQRKFEESRLKEDYRPLFSQIVHSTSLAYEQIAKNTLCIERNPNVLPTVGSLISSISYSLSGINPVVGIGLGASTELVGMIIEAKRKKKFNGLINKVKINSLSPAAYRCALESLSDRWCEVVEVDELRKFKFNIEKNAKIKEVKTAFKVIDEELPVILDWLNYIRTGLDPSTTADADRLKKIYNRRTLVQSAKVNGLGLISEKKPIFNSQDDKWTLYRSIIISLAGNGFSGGGNNNNPLFEIYTNQYAPYYLVGLAEIPRDIDKNTIPFTNFDPVQNWPPGSAIEYDLDKLSQRFQSWVNRAEVLVENELSLVSRPDPLQVLTTAFERADSIYKKYPAEALYFVQSFFEAQEKFFEGKRHHRIFKSTLKKIRCVNLWLETIEFGIELELEESIIENCSVSNTSKEELLEKGYFSDEPKIILQNIISKLGISDTTRTFQSRIESIMRTLIDSYITKADQKDLNVISQLLASESVLQKIKEVRSTDNWGLMSIDLDQAKSVAMSNLSQFTSLFEKNIRAVLRDYYQKRGERDPTLRKVYLKNRESLCTLLSTAPKWPSTIPKRFCIGLQLKSEIKNAPKGPYLSESYLNSSFGKRVCGYRKFIRQTRIFQTWDL